MSPMPSSKAWFGVFLGLSGKARCLHQKSASLFPSPTHPPVFITDWLIPISQSFHFCNSALLPKPRPIPCPNPGTWSLCQVSILFDQKTVTTYKFFAASNAITNRNLQLPILPPYALFSSELVAEVHFTNQKH